jgi:hypothetical protein
VNNSKSIGGNDELSVGVAAHAVDGAGGASSDGIGIAAGMLGGDGDGTIGTTHDDTVVIEGIGGAEVDDEAGVFGAAHKGDGGAHFNAEGFVGLSAGNARGRGGIGSPAALDVDGAGRGSGAASVRCGTNAGRICSGANVALDFLFGVLANDETSQEKRQDEQTTENCQIAINLHQAPHSVEMNNQN